MDRYEEICARLAQLREAAERRRKIDAMLLDLEEQRRDLLNWEDTLGQTWGKEEADVEKLERGLSGFLAALRGGKEERLERERAEAYAARLRYDGKVRERQDVERRMAELRREQADLDRLRREYDDLLEEKRRLLRQRSGAVSERIGALEEELAQVCSACKEVQEALSEGSRTRGVVREALSHLDAASDYGVWDMVGGGLLATAFKHGEMDHAQDYIERIQWHLSRFSSELRDVQMYIDADLKTDGMLGFADYFFDGLLVDWMVQSRIDSARDSVRNCGEQVDRVLGRLEDQRRTLEARREQLEQALAELVAGA